MESTFFNIYYMAIKTSQEEFIRKSIEFHKGKYDYSFVEYVNTNTKVKIICKEHGEFLQTPKHHLRHECSKCGNKIMKDKQSKSLDSFIGECHIKYPNKYDYSKVTYINNKTEVDITCKEHGEFKTRPDLFLQGKCCKKCLETKEKITTESYIERCIEAHGDKYDYSLVEYNGMNQKVYIICSSHGVISMRASDHCLGKHNCPRCSHNIKLTNELFIERSTKIHGNKYDYSLVDIGSKNNKERVKIFCKSHGVFEQSINCHLRNRNCPRCKTSKGENLIENTLIENNISYERQKKFDDLIDKSKLLFDFYIPSFNLLIEYDGKQHFVPVKRFGGDVGFINTKRRDSLKDTYCILNNIKLIRIPYTLIDDEIEKIILDNVC